MSGAGMPSLGTPANNRAVRTSQFAGSSDFRPLGADEVAQAGDIVAQGGHAGLFTGRYNSGGFPIVLQNGTRGVKEITFGVNADGSGQNGLASMSPVFHRRQLPINR